MNRKRGRENNVSPTLYLMKKHKSEIDETNENTLNNTTRNMLIVIIDKIERIESELKMSNNKIQILQQSNISYQTQLNDIYTYFGLMPDPTYNHTNSYIT